MLNFKKQSYPLNNDNVEDYIKSEYKKFNILNSRTNILSDFKLLNQADYKDKRNCSITSMTACINYFSGNEYEVTDIYSTVKKIAYCFLYTPHLFGTLSFTIISIYKLALRKYKFFGKQKLGYFKLLGMNRAIICNLINSEHPIILNMFRDGRGFYKNHTVTIIGYKKYYSTDGKELFFLIINDNWSKEIRFLDYQKLWILSSINYV